MLIGDPTNQPLPASDVAPLASATIWFLFVDQLKSLVQVRPRQFCRLTVENEISYPVFFVEPTFWSVEVKPDVTGSSSVNRRSCVFMLYQSIVPEMRSLNSA